MGDILDIIISLFIALGLLCAITVPFAIQYIVRDMIFYEDDEEVMDEEIH